MRTIEYVLCVLWHQNIFSSHLHLQINQQASPKSVQNEVCPFLNTKSQVGANFPTAINKVTALSKHLYLFQNKISSCKYNHKCFETLIWPHIGWWMECVGNRDGMQFIPTLKRWVSFKYLQIVDVNLWYVWLWKYFKTVISIWIPVWTLLMCWHIITQYILIFLFAHLLKIK